MKAHDTHNRPNNTHSNVSQQYRFSSKHDSEDISPKSSFYNFFEKNNSPKIKKVEPLAKADYKKILAKERKKFLYSIFADELAIIFDRLRFFAKKMKPLALDVTFKVPTEYNTDKIEEMLKAYFKEDLGYYVYIRPVKELDGGPRSIIEMTLA